MTRGLQLFFQTPYSADYGPMKKASGTYFPIGIGYLASFIKRHGFSAALLDPNVQDLPIARAVERARELKPSCVGISFMTPQFYWARDLAAALKTALPDTPIVMGGAHPSVLPERTLEEVPQADFVVYGEGELTNLELMEHLTEGKREAAEIDGLAWRDDGVIRLNPPRAPIEDLDSLPDPDRDLIDQSLYHVQSFLSHSSKALSIYTSRGCPGRCVFCASGHKLRSRVRDRSIPSVMAEIDTLRERFKIDYLLIKDDTFTMRKQRVEEFCDAISTRHSGLKWHCMLRVNSVTESLLKRMKEAGLNDVFFGIESGNDEILKKARKGITTERARKAVDICARLGVRSYGAFILGLPGDTHETIEQTIRFACSLPLTLAGFSILTPYPGTQCFEEYYTHDENEPIDYHQFVASSGIQYVEGYTGPVGVELSELPTLISRAQKRFYLRPSQTWRILRSSSPSMLLGCVKGATALVGKELYLRKRNRETRVAQEKTAQ